MSAAAVLGPMLVPIARKLVGKAISQLPGTMIDGPAGAAIAGQIVDGVAERFGIPPRDLPARVDRLLDEEGAAVAETVDRIAADNSGQWLELRRTQVAAVNATMQAEHGAGSILSRTWRPVFGFGFTLVYVLLGLSFAVAIWADPDPLNSMVALSGLLMAFVGAGAAVLGVYVSGRSAEKRAGVSR